ncbi:hypothetical protein M885DRAFT_559964 [Pelagophyceae sp. CCMP2097]|nr:hypothetical protein M885DRAFT_559964 [Pelagophyceae sp. CCMP2097]
MWRSRRVLLALAFARRVTTDSGGDGGADVRQRNQQHVFMVERHERDDAVANCGGLLVQRND